MTSCFSLSHSRLKELDLSQNRLESCSLHGTCMQSADLSRNELESCEFTLPRLRYLNLKKNCLKELSLLPDALPFSIYGLSLLQYLDLSENLIKQVSGTTQLKFKACRYLNVKDNCFTDYTWLAMFPLLTELVVSGESFSVPNSHRHLV